MLVWAALLVLLLAAAAALATGWVMSNRFLVPQPYGLVPEFRIGAVREEAGGLVVELPTSESPDQFGDVRKEGIYNLLWEDGYGRLGPVVEDRGDRVARPLDGLVGEPPRAGSPARLDVTVYRRDPWRDHGLPFEDLRLHSGAGLIRAWWVADGSERAVLAVHGRRRADLTETLRIMPVLADAGWSVMALSYRNHDLSDPGEDGLFHYGHSEVDDVFTGLAELTRRGVREVVLYGFSMGGALALEAAKRWPEEAPLLRGMVLDAPLLDPRTVIAHGARTGGLPFPGMITDISLAVAGLRTGVRWSALDQRRTGANLDVPLLLFAGTADDTIPISLVDEFAAQVTAPLEYLRFDGADHLEGWNRERERYEQAVQSFLTSIPAGE